MLAPQQGPLMAVALLLLLLQLQLHAAFALSSAGPTITVNANADASLSGKKELRSMALPTFSLAQLQDPHDDIRDRLADAVFNVGMFAVEGHGCSHATDPFSGSLHAYLQCVNDTSVMDGGLLKVQMEDATERVTLATSTNSTVAQPMPSEIVDMCPRFAQTSAQLRASADETGAAYASLLDRLVHGQSKSGVLASGADSYEAAVLRSESLEHFHIFRREHQPQEDVATLSLHTDVGLFIVMTAPEYFSEPGAHRLEGDGKPQSGFVLELPSGELVRPVIPDGSFLVLNGEGASKWIKAAHGSRMPRAASHEVTVPDIHGMARAWFGRMYFPPRDAMLQGSSEPISFGEYRQQTYADFHDGNPTLMSSVGCSPARGGGRSLLQDQGSCAGDEVYCWMMCMKVGAHLNCSRDDILCQDPAGQLWPDAFTGSDGKPGHCFDCDLACAEKPPPPPSPSPSPPLPLMPSPPSPYPPPPSLAVLYAAARDSLERCQANTDDMGAELDRLRGELLAARAALQLVAQALDRGLNQTAGEDV